MPLLKPPFDATETTKTHKFDILKTLQSAEDSERRESAEDTARRARIYREIEVQLQELPTR